MWCEIITSRTPEVQVTEIVLIYKFGIVQELTWMKKQYIKAGLNGWRRIGLWRRMPKCRTVYGRQDGEKLISMFKGKATIVVGRESEVPKTKN